MLRRGCVPSGDQQAIAPAVDRDADLVRGAEPHLADEPLAGGRLELVPPARADVRSEFLRRGAHVIACEVHRGTVLTPMALDREPQLVDERGPALVDVVVV